MPNPGKPEFGCGERAQDWTNNLVRVRGALKLPSRFKPPLTPSLSPLRGARERTAFAARSCTAARMEYATQQ
jgi:hypothetical protein